MSYFYSNIKIYWKNWNNFFKYLKKQLYIDFNSGLALFVNIENVIKIMKISSYMDIQQMHKQEKYFRMSIKFIDKII